ncbi:MAG: DUF4038 domain-containing protein, partial [Planctomycetes bacterium]|nr:DUF4038 domain-containing protein [Planctomycetota bacterium]
PAKPTLDAEVAYENSLSLRKEEPQDRRITPWEVRKAAYWAVFAGGFGHTYGHRSFIQWTRQGENTGRGGDVPWYEMLEAPAANQMRHLRALMESRPFLCRVPDQGLLVGDAGKGDEHIQATRGDGYAFIYAPTGRKFTVKLAGISQAKVKSSWFDPRTGQTTSAGEFESQEPREFVPPSSGPDHDWVLVLDDARQARSVPVRAYPETSEGVKASASAEARLWSVHEIELTAQGEYANPYTGVEVMARFTGPGGRQHAVRGFWDGGRTFRVRFTPPLRGQWMYEVQSVPADAGLTHRGAFEVTPPARVSHGFLRRDARYPTSFVFDDGTRHFMCGTTYYHLLLNARAGDRWQAAIDGAVRYGMNKARFSLYPSPAQGGVGRYPLSTPFTDEGLMHPDLDHWRAADQVVRYMAARGFLADVILFWTKPKGSEKLLREDERYLRYALARLAAFPNVIWCMVNEWNYSEVPQDYWNRLGRLVREEDPWSKDGDFVRVLSIHQQTRPDWNFADQMWPSHAILQLGVRNRGPSVRIGDEWVEAGQGSRRFRHGDEWGNHSIVRNWTGKYPVVNDEFGYIGEPQDVSEDRQPDGSFQRFTRVKHRHTMWAIAAGGGYGATGDKNDYDDGRPYFSTNWHDTPEYGDVRQLVTFFSKGDLQYWKMAPRNELVKSGTRVYVLAEPARQYVIYAAAGGPFSLDLAPGRYRTSRFDPRTGEETALPEVTGGAVREFTSPDAQDWVLRLTVQGFGAPTRTEVMHKDALLRGANGKQDGGRFVAQGGWTPVGPKDRIVWELPRAIRNGCLEIDVRNLNPAEQATVDKSNILGMWETLWKNGEDTGQAHRDHWGLRIGKGYPQLKIKIHTADMCRLDKPFAPLTEGFDPQRTYHIKVEWNEGRMRFSLDGREFLAWESPGIDPMDTLRYIHLGSDTQFDHRAGSAVAGPVYSNLTITEYQ